MHHERLGRLKQERASIEDPCFAPLVCDLAQGSERSFEKDSRAVRHCDLFNCELSEKGLAPFAKGRMFSQLLVNVLDLSLHSSEIALLA